MTTDIVFLVIWGIVLIYIIYKLFFDINKTKGHIALRTVNELLKQMGIRVEQYNSLDETAFYDGRVPTVERINNNYQEMSRKIKDLEERLNVSVDEKLDELAELMSEIVMVSTKDKKELKEFHTLLLEHLKLGVKKEEACIKLVSKK